MTIYRDAAEQSWRDYDEGMYDPDVIVEREREDRRLARLDEMSWPTADITVEPTADITVEPQPEFLPPTRTVRSHEVRSYGKMTFTDWFFLISGLALCVGWGLLLLAVMYAVTVG